MLTSLTSALLLSSASVANASPPPSSLHHAQCCSTLKSQPGLEGKVFLPSDTEYKTLLSDYYSANAAQPAWCIVAPTNTGDVSVIAHTLYERKCPFGIKAGGHSAWKGANGIRNGVTVDLVHLNSTTYHQSAQLVSIQPGARWGSVYEALQPFGRTLAGARTSVVGVGGFTTGGGYSFHSNERGFACDNVVNWEIVLYNGTIVNANATHNRDLWKAQKGASGNLGIVTRIDAYTLGGTKLWGGFTSYSLTERDAVFNAYLDFTARTEPDSKDQNLLGLFYDSTGFSLRSILTNTDGVANGTAFREYLSIPNIGSTLTTGEEADLIPQFTGPTPLGQYANWFTGTASSTFTAMDAVDTLHHEYVARMLKAAPGANFSTLIELQPITKTMVENSVRRGGNVLGLERVVANGPALMWLVSLTCGSAADQDVILPIAHEFVEAINRRQKEQGTFVDWVYLNYAWEDEAPFTHYGQQNLAFLWDVSQRYDPAGVFQNQRMTGFHLPPRRP